MPALALVLAAPACTVWPTSSDPNEVGIDANLTPTEAAWIAAETARTCFPSADPLPQHAGAPAVRVEADSFVVHVARTGPGGYSIATNGRLLPPPLRGRAELCDLAAIAFAPDLARRAADAATDRATVRITRRGGQSHLSVRLLGDAERSAMLPRLRRALELADAVKRTATLLRQRHSGRAMVLAERRLGPADGDYTGLLSQLRTRLLVHLAVARIGLGEPAEARRALVAALADGGDCHAARALQIRLDDRGAERRILERNRRLMAATPGVLLAATTRTPSPRTRAADLASAGDHQAARRWLELATTLDPHDMASLGQLAATCRQLGRPRIARDTALMQIAERGVATDLMPGLAADAHAMGRPSLALRWIARHWQELADHERDGTSAGIARASRDHDQDESLRVLASERVDTAELPLLGPAFRPHPELHRVELPASHVAAPPQ